jgi:hypothetical protein
LRRGAVEGTLQRTQQPGIGCVAGIRQRTDLAVELLKLRIIDHLYDISRIINDNGPRGIKAEFDWRCRV